MVLAGAGTGKTSLLVERMPHKALEDRMAGALGMNHEEFWCSIDRTVVAYFEREAAVEDG